MARAPANGATWIDAEGEEHHTPASLVIVCANGVGTPRLLRLSASNLFPDGLANSSGLVGKRLMMHPFVGAWASWPSGMSNLYAIDS